MKTRLIRVRIRKSDAALTFLDGAGTVLLGEGGDARHISAAGTGPVTQAFETATPLYGLGQHQNGLLDYSGASVRLQQQNRDVAVPMMVCRAASVCSGTTPP